MPAWFDLARVDQLLKGEQDGPGVSASVAHIGAAQIPALSVGTDHEDPVLGLESSHPAPHVVYRLGFRLVCHYDARPGTFPLLSFPSE